MPFTASHPAAVLPLRRLGLPMTGLVVGSMVPDLPLFGLAPWSYPLSHSAIGIVGVDLLAGILLTAAWTLLLRDPCADLAPGPVRVRVPARPRVSPREWVLTPLAVVLGAMTHVVWDEFTHEGRWGARHVLWLAHDHARLPGFKWAQYVSGALGFALVIAYLVGHFRSRPAPAAPSPEVSRGVRRLLRLAVVVGVALVVAVVALPRLAQGVHAAEYEVFRRSGVPVVLVVLVVAALWQALRRRTSNA